jgi:hypothetical protein
MLKSIFALALAGVSLVASVTHWRRHRSFPAVLFVGAASCFTVVAIAHLFEAFSILPVAGWGQQRSVGHYIDLSAAVLGASFALAGMSAVARRRGRRTTLTR